MRKYYFMALFAIASLSVSAQTTTLVVKTDPLVRELRYWALSGETLPYYNLAPTLSPNADGVFKIDLSIGKPMFYDILVGKKCVKIYIAPNNVDTLTIQHDSCIFTGSNKVHNMILVELEKSDKYCKNYSRTRGHELEKIIGLEDFKKVIGARKAKDDSLLLAEGLSEYFVKQEKKTTDIRYRLLFFRKIFSLYNSPNLTNDWLMELKKEIDIVLRGENAMMSVDYNKLLEVMISCQAFMLEGKEPQQIRDTFNTFRFNNYCAILEGEQLEYTLAFLIHGDFFQKDHSKDVPGLFYRFEKLFPGSPFISVLKPGVVETAAIYSAPLDKSVLFMENTEVNTFQDLTRVFAGKVVYIDLWATWCAPCISMFSHLEALKQVLKTMDVTYLYISLDKEHNDGKWREMANYYKLEGHNLRVNSQLSNSIFTQFGNKQGLLSIPRNIIISKDGKVVFNDAASPDEPQKVVEQLKIALE